MRKMVAAASRRYFEYWRRRRWMRSEVLFAVFVARLARFSDAALLGAAPAVELLLAESALAAREVVALTSVAGCSQL